MNLDGDNHRLNVVVHCAVVSSQLAPFVVDKSLSSIGPFHREEFKNEIKEERELLQTLNRLS